MTSGVSDDVPPPEGGVSVAAAADPGHQTAPARDPAPRRGHLARPRRGRRARLGLLRDRARPPAGEDPAPARLADPAAGLPASGAGGVHLPRGLLPGGGGGPARRRGGVARDGVDRARRDRRVPRRGASAIRSATWSGREWGEQVLRKIPDRLLDEDRLQKGRAYIRRMGAKGVILGRWTAALRALVPGLAGMSHMHYPRFLIANVIGGVGWATLVAVVGYLAGNSYKKVESALGSVSYVLLGLIVVGFIAWHIVRRRREVLRPGSQSAPVENPPDASDGRVSVRRAVRRCDCAAGSMCRSRSTIRGGFRWATVRSKDRNSGRRRREWSGPVGEVAVAVDGSRAGEAPGTRRARPRIQARCRRSVLRRKAAAPRCPVAAAGPVGRRSSRVSRRSRWPSSAASAALRSRTTRARRRSPRSRWVRARRARVRMCSRAQPTR